MATKGGGGRKNFINSKKFLTKMCFRRFLAFDLFGWGGAGGGSVQENPTIFQPECVLGHSTQQIFLDQTKFLVQKIIFN